MKTSLEIPDSLWEEAKLRAIRERKSLAAVVTDALRRYLGAEQPKGRTGRTGGKRGKGVSR
jgi:hypothetical protein